MERIIEEGIALDGNLRQDLDEEVGLGLLIIGRAKLCSKLDKLLVFISAYAD